MITSSSEIRVRYCETDAMRIVHHSHFANWFELARIDLLDKIRCPYRQLEQEGFFMPLIEIQTQFITPAFFDDRLIIHVSIPEIPLVRIHVDYRIFRESTLIARGYTIHAFIDTKGRAIKPPKFFLESISKAVAHP